MLAVLEERSVTAAAARVGMTQPAMSHALRRMRRLMGDELLVRQGAGMALTPRGLDLVAPLRRALRHTAEVVRPTSFDPASDTRVVTLAMTGSTALPLMGRIARLVAGRAPNIVLRLRTLSLTGPADDVLTHEGVDVLLLPRAFATSFERERLYDDRWVVITGGSAPDAPVEELIGSLPHVVLDSPTYRVRPYEVLDERGVGYRIRVRVSDQLLVPHAVAATGGLAFHRHRVVREMTRYLDLRVHDFPFPIGGLGIDLVWNPWLSDDDLRSWLGELVREAVGES
jgi:DNA-binding transcriptional LysR family regulator